MELVELVKRARFIDVCSLYELGTQVSLRAVIEVVFVRWWVVAELGIGSIFCAVVAGVMEAVLGGADRAVAVECGRLFRQLMIRRLVLRFLMPKVAH